MRLRVGSALEAGLWLVVLVKFLMPVGPSWTFSLSNMCQHLRGSPPVHDIAPIEPNAFYAENVYAANIRSIDLAAPSEAPTMPQQSSPTRDASRLSLQWTTLVAAAYVLCVFGLFVLRIGGYHRLVAHCRSLPQADVRTLDVVTTVCRGFGIRLVPTVKISDDKPPFVMGLVRPLIVIPRHLLVRPDELETVIVHEIAHLRRGDIVVRYIQWIAGILFFFWPVVAWINRRLNAKREYACDEWALRQGKLSAPEYARCLLRMVQLVRRPFAYAPCSMAINPKTIERRIDMILKSKQCVCHRRLWRLLACAFLLGWACVTLTGVATGSRTAGLCHSRVASEESVWNRAAAIYNLVAERGAADINSDGLLTYLERDTYLVALAMRNAEPFMDEFPYADRNHSGHLDILEANAVIRAITLIAYADRRACAATEQVLPLEFCHEALDAQEWLMGNAASEPDAKELDQIWSVLYRVQGHPNSFSARIFDRCGPEEVHALRKIHAGSRSRFQEIENGIAALKDRMLLTQDPTRIAKLETMIAKLESILTRLQE
jgi:beta-lactamase regulating signal transducer with metallopeptidase domain